MSPTCISVVVPVYNEDHNIEQCLRGLWEALRPYEHEILVCYDFDEDTTLGAIARMADAPPSLRLVKNDLGRGAANALRAGFLAARGDVVVTTMADLSDPPEAIPRMAARMRSLGAAVVSGSRYMKGGSQTGGPFVKRCLSQAASLSLRWFAGIGTHDATTNFRAYSRAWLARTTVESRDSFDIALELTVKAHLGGERVAEVPSSWIDRVFGESRFKVMQWLPKYLRWYWKAAAEPFVVWAVFAALLATALVAGGWTPKPSGADTVLVLLQGLVALLCVLAVRAIRGRMRSSDALVPVLWLHPWHPQAFHAGLLAPDLAATAAATLGLMVFTCRHGQVRAAVRHWSRYLLQTFRPGHLGLLLVAALVWMTHFQLTDMAAEMGLDPSWRRAYSHFWLHGWQAGVDYAFTYGPLGFLEFGAYVPGTYWEDMLAWEVIAKGGLALLLVWAVQLMHNPVDKSLYLIALLFGGLSPDAYHFLAILVVTGFLIRRPDATGWGLAAGFLALALLAALKFTALVLVFACVLGVAVDVGLRRTWLRAVGVLGLWLVVFFLVWWVAARQLPWNFPAYLLSALPVASGYSEAMSVTPETAVLKAGVLACVLTAAAAALLALERPWSSGRALYAALVVAGFWLAFKSAFVRHGGSVTFFGFAAAAVLLLQRPSAVVAVDWRRKLLDGATACLRYACVAVTVLHNPIVRAAGSPADMLGQWAAQWNDRVAHVGLIPVREAWLDTAWARMREHLDLPRIRAHVGERPVDLVTVDQELVLINELHWNPRPVFQSYSAYTPRLLRMNLERFEGEGALPFVLVSLSNIDGRYALMQDNLALQAILRDYAPVLVEKKILLLERQPRVPVPARTLLMEREIGFDETIELPPPDGVPRVLTMDIGVTPRGKLRNFLLSTPELYLQADLADGQSFTGRVVPTLLREGLVLDPMLFGHHELQSWLAGQEIPAVLRIRMLRSRGHPRCFGERIPMRLERAADLQPRPVDERLAAQMLYPMFDPTPTDVQSLHRPGRVLLEEPPGTEALLVQAPAQITFALEPGLHKLRALYGMLPSSYLEGETDGVVFSVLAKEADAPAQVIFERRLDPRDAPGDRGPQVFERELRVPRPMKILLRTMSDDPERDWAWWGEVQLLPLPAPTGQGG